MPANRFEVLAAWYLRFNGYFTTANFIRHRDYEDKPGGTDADILAVRFPASEEYTRGYKLERDPLLVRPDWTDFLICEVKSGLCDINPNSWRDPNRKNVEYAIQWMGITSNEDDVSCFANNIYAKGEAEVSNKRCSIRFVCFGDSENPKLKHELPRVQQIFHSHVVEFLWKRFNTGCCGIVRHHWDAEIIEFSKKCKNCTPDDLMKWAKRG